MSDSAHSSRAAAGRAANPADPDAAYVPSGGAGDVSPAGRYGRVLAERQSAATQMRSSLRVWRKVDEDASQKKEEEPQEAAGEGEAQEEEQAAGAEGAAKQEEEAPPVSAKLEGVGLKVFRAAEGNQKDSGVVAKAQQMIDDKKATDMEDALNKLYNSTSGPERNKVKATQKAFGFRHSRQS